MGRGSRLLFLSVKLDLRSWLLRVKKIVKETESQKTNKHTYTHTGERGGGSKEEEAIIVCVFEISVPSEGCVELRFGVVTYQQWGRIRRGVVSWWTCSFTLCPIFFSIVPCLLLHPIWFYWNPHVQSFCLALLVLMPTFLWADLDGQLPPDPVQSPICVIEWSLTGVPTEVISSRDSF